MLCDVASLFQKIEASFYLRAKIIGVFENSKKGLEKISALEIRVFLFIPRGLGRVTLLAAKN